VNSLRKTLGDEIFMNTISINTFSNAMLSQYAKKALCKIAGYYANDVLYSFQYSPSGITLTVTSQANFTPQLLIVAREYYQEQLSSYPITEKKELKKLLALELSQVNGSQSGASPSAKLSHVVSQIVSQNESTSQVNSWKFRSNLPVAKMVIPESFLLAQLLTVNQLIEQETLDKQKLYITRLNDGVVSAYKHSLINSPERFCNSVGLSLPVPNTNEVTDTQVLASSANDFAMSLIDGVVKAPIKLLAKFVKRQSSTENMPIIKTVALPIVVILTAYLALSSAWLYWQQSSLEQQIAEQKNEINQALGEQDQYNVNLSKLAILNEFLVAQQAKSLLWLVLANVIEDAQIRTLRYSKGRYILIGRTHEKPDKNNVNREADSKSDESDTTQESAAIYKATDFLEKLIQQKGVVDAKFDSAVRRSKRYESFTVSFVLSTNDIANNELAEDSNGIN